MASEQGGFLRDTPPAGGVHGALVVTGDTSGGSGATEATLLAVKNKLPGALVTGSFDSITAAVISPTVTTYTYKLVAAVVAVLTVTTDVAGNFVSVTS